MKLEKKPLTRILFAWLALVLAITACDLEAGPALPLRSDMPTSGLEGVVTYKLNGPAGSDSEENVATYRGVNDYSPMAGLENRFGKLPGSKTQDVVITLPNGYIVRALGMNKIKRFAGLTGFITYETATYTATDANGHSVCGLKVRLDFTKNLVQYTDPDQRDFNSLWYYDVPCSTDGVNNMMLIDQASLRAVVINEVWRPYIFFGSNFRNWGHSVTIIPGNAVRSLAPRWWEKLDAPNSSNDVLMAADLANKMVNDLSTSSQPWLEFANTSGLFSDSYVIYSAGDADKYATWDRILLDRQTQYAVFYRPSREITWDWITIKPVYNYEFNDAGQILAKAQSWGNDPFAGRLDERGLPKDPNDSVISEIERIGFMNAPNPSLEQIQYLDKSGTPIYSMTVRAYVGANDTLMMFGPTLPSLQEAQKAPLDDQLPMPLAYDSSGNPIQNPDFTPEQWESLKAEGSMWNYLKGTNPFGSDLFIQYRFTDNTSWNPVICYDSEGDSYTCGYSPVEWKLNATYFLDGKVRRPWLSCQLLGEVGVRTLGMSYVSGLYEGTGTCFAMSQQLFREEFFSGFTQESVWRFDARASQLPDTLAEAWVAIHNP